MEIRGQRRRIGKRRRWLAVGAKEGAVVGTMTSSLRGCPGNGKHSPRRDADARRHRRKNQFRPWLGDRSVLARRCCDAASFALSGEATRTTLLWRCRAVDCHHRTTSEPHKLGVVSQAPAVASGQPIERLLHRGACDGIARAKAHHTHLHTTYTHYRHIQSPRIHTGAAARAHAATRAYALLARATRRITQRKEQRWRKALGRGRESGTRTPSSFRHGKTRACVRIAVRTSLRRIVEADA